MIPRKRRPPEIHGDIALVDLAGRAWVIVDVEDLPRVVQKPWSRVKGKHTFYASSGGKLYLHRFILGATKSQQVDHVNGDGLDNRKSNLRFASQAQNNANGRNRTWREHFRGVRPHVRKWTAQVTFNSRAIYLGTFDTEVAAATAYDAKARELFGEFAKGNFQ